jgi:hypothetical protein
MMMENLVEWRLAGETEVLGENLPQCHFVHHKSHMTWHGLKPRPPPWYLWCSCRLLEGDWTLLNFKFLPIIKFIQSLVFIWLIERTKVENYMECTYFQDIFVTVHTSLAFILIYCRQIYNCKHKQTVAKLFTRDTTLYRIKLVFPRISVHFHHTKSPPTLTCILYCAVTHFL